MTIGETVKKFRLKKGYQQQQFARELKVSTQYYNMVEKGRKTCSEEFLKKIAEKLEIPFCIIYWLSVEESDLNPDKRESFRVVKPIVDALITTIV